VATFQSTVLPALDALRAIGGKLGLRVFSVTVRQRVWTGSRPGVGTKSDTDILLVNQAADGTLQPVRVRQVSRREAIASGGKYTDRDLRIGPLTPPYAAVLQMGAGGFDDTVLDPADTTSATEMLWIVTSTSGTYGIPSGGIVCKKIGEEATSLHYYVIVRATGQQT